MKAPAFNYARPSRLSEVFSLLEKNGDDARLLAGGQTLMPTLNMRLSEPALLIDLQALPELRGMSVNHNCLRIGAMVSHSEIEASPLVAQHAPLLSMAAPYIAHRAIRNLGTFGGSIALSDPAAEWPACLLALDGVVIAHSAQGQRRIAAQDFFTGLYSTALNSNEVIVACEIPLASAKQRFTFLELARRQGDYAVLGLAAAIEFNSGVFDSVRLAWLGLGSKPQRAPATEQLLQGLILTADLRERALQVLRSELEIQADLTHSVAAKKHLASIMLQRALAALAVPASATAQGKL